MTRRLTLCLSLSLSMAAMAMPGRDAQDDRLSRLRDWLESVQQHRPGRADPSVLAVVSQSPQKLAEVLDELGRLTDRLAEAAALAGSLGSGDQTRVAYAGATISVQEMRALLGLSEDEIAARDPTRILKRAAVLHADVAMLSEGVWPPVRPLSSAGQPSVMLVRDGMTEGFDAANVHWAFGRRLLARVKPTPARDPMVRLWYQAAAAFMHVHSKFGDLALHIEPALRLFPTDADILFAGGALHESYASAAVQSVIRTIVVPKGARPSVLTATAELDLAERFFSRALRYNPELVEASLRRARVLGLQGRHQEAATVLRQVLEVSRDTLLRYYAELFLGEEERALGDREAARAAFERAATLYPAAQSPRFALGLLARQAGDRAGGLIALGHVISLTRRPITDDDPWWTYDTSAGRRVNALLETLYQPFADGGPR